jgi:3-hydroxyisobutyrate dehydrogenase-like beta-hydroxyacid dehydrogenase
MTTPTTYGFIGLGHQGTPMAERMIAGGLRPWLWARRREVLDRYRDTEACLATSPAELGARCDVVGLCLYDAEATDAVLFGPEGLMSAVRPGTVLAVHATVGPRYMIDLGARVAERGVRVVDAPVSGGPAALAGQLLVILGGDDQDCRRCASMFDTYAGKVARVGALGAAQAAKLVNNGLMTAITGLVFDAFDLGDALGIDPAGLGEVLANGSAANPSVGVYLAIGAEDFSIRAWPTLHKDVALLESLARSTPLGSGLLVSSAAATIREMAHRRAGYVASRTRCDV